MTARVPPGTSARFVLLIAAVVATAAMVLTNIYAFVPSKVERFNTTYVHCTEQRNADPDWTRLVQTRLDRDRQIAAFQRWQRCLRAAFTDEAVFVGYGLGLVFGLSALLYVLHPWWRIRRRRLEPLLAEDAPELVGYVNDLCRQMAVTPPRRWLLSPSARVGGQAFGLPGCRYVQLDAGLIPLYTTNRPAFRAVVAHELAHLRNRDVDKTYFAIAIWWSFVAVAVVPFLTLIVHPLLLRAPLTWHWRNVGQAGGGPGHMAYVVGSLVALAALVYLTRNAILRVREVEADAVAAGYDDPDGAMATVIDGLPATTGSFWRTRLGTHPHTCLRKQAVKEPRTLLRPGLWVLVGTGITAGMFGVNLVWVVRIVVINNPVLTQALVGLTAGWLMTAMLAVEVWRGSAAEPGARPSTRTWLAAPLSLVAGFVAGTALLLRMFRPWDGLLPLGTVTATTMLLTAGAMLLTGWLVSTCRSVLAAPGNAWVMPVVVATSVVAVMPWFAVWFAFRQQDGAWMPTLGEPPDPTFAASWYEATVRWTGMALSPLDWVYANPLTLPGLTLLWLVPVLTASRRQQPVSLRLAVYAGLAGGAVMTIVAVALPYLARAALPLAARHAPGPEPDLNTVPFAFAYNNAYIAIALLTQAVVAAVVAGRASRHRPALTLFAVLLTAALSVVGLFWVSLPVGRCIGLYGEGLGSCFIVPGTGYVTDIVEWVAVKGIVVAIPAALLGAMLGAWRRHGHIPGTAPASTRSPRRAYALAAVAGLLVAASATATVIGLEHAYQVWIAWSI